MAFESVNYQCPACGGPLHFASAEQKLVCDYCDSRFEVEEVEALYRERQDKADAKADAAAAAPKPAVDDAVQELAQNAGYICSSCGAELVSDGTVAVTTCPYCGNSAVAPGQLSGDFSPDLVIPFKLGRDDVMAALKDHYKGKNPAAQELCHRQPYRRSPRRLRAVLALRRPRGRRGVL